MGTAATESVSLETIVSCAAVSIICYHEVILSHLVGHFLDHGAGVLLRNFRKVCRSQEFFVFLLLEHGAEFGSHSNAHLIDLTLSAHDSIFRGK